MAEILERYLSKEKIYIKKKSLIRQYYYHIKDKNDFKKLQKQYSEYLGEYDRNVSYYDGQKYLKYLKIYYENEEQSINAYFSSMIYEQDIIELDIDKEYEFVFEE